MFSAIDGYNIGAVYGPIITGEQTVAQAVEAQKPVIQNAINKIFNPEAYVEPEPAPAE
jgi:hypothetical protein